MGCDLVFKINGRLNGGLFDEQPSDLNVTIKDSEIMSDIHMYSYSDTFKSIHQLSLVNVARQLMKNKTELSQLISYIRDLKDSGKSRSINAKDIKKRGIIGNFKYNVLRAMYTDEKKVHFPNLQTPYNPDILLVDSLYLNGVDYKDVIFSNDVNGTQVYVVSDKPESIERLNRHLAVRDAILNNFEGDEELEKLMPKFREAGKNFDTQQELLVDFLQNNSDYRDLVPQTYGLLSEIVKNIENENRLGYKEVLDREFHHILDFHKGSKFAHISIQKFTNFLSENTPDLVQDLTKEDLKGETKHYLYFSIIVIISALPLIVFIFLQLYKVIKLSNYKKDEINNKLISESQNKNNKILKANEIEERELKIREIMPKWFRLLNEYFNLLKNGSELFNFSLNQTNFNDFNGITYIKGILGLSMFLNIIGLTLFILSNLPTKILGTYQFYYSVNNLFYILAFIGLRYCPRIIFSCNGYTLIYKFLNFIEHDPNFCFFKFLILQSYKFILLIFVSLYLRFCLYYIDVIFLNIRNPMSELFHNQLEENSNKYFYNLLSFLFYNIQKNELFTNETAFIQYLYLPINEIFLFIVGIAIISFGYKFKLRFDIIIIVLFVLVYLFKILFFILYMYEREIYSTLYFFLHGYGVLMLNPIFNLPSFLVGMYFGLVNFTIHRGINNLNKDEKYKEYELLESENQSINLEKTATRGEKKLGLYINNNNDLEEDKLSRILTYSGTNSTVFDENHYYVSTKKNNLSLCDEDEKSNTDAEKENRGNKEKKENNNHILKKMPFLKSTVNFTNFHRKNQNKNSLKIILVIFLILLVFFISVRYIFIHIYITKDIKTDARISDILSFEKIITNYFLNILYVVDIELVVIIINWICFYLYFKGGQINDFLNHIYWSFFIKSYFSYALVSCPVILYIFYQSETIVTVTIFNILLYSLISCFFVFIVVIVFYSFYEYPLRKIFKTLKIRRSYINIDDDDFYEEENDD